MAERHVHVVAGIMRSTKFCPGYTPVLSDIVKQLLVCKWINITKRKIGKPVSYQNLVVIHAMVPESCEKEYKTAMVKMFRNSILSVMDYQDEEAKQSYERSIYEKLTKHTSLLNTLRHGADVTAGRYNYLTQTLPATQQDFLSRVKAYTETEEVQFFLSNWRKLEQDSLPAVNDVTGDKLSLRDHDDKDAKKKTQVVSALKQFVTPVVSEADQ